MCGIDGFTFADEKRVQMMNDVLRHRGPDDQGIYVDESVSLGHRRLSIIDLSETGHQPMSYADQMLWLTFNGEIYNYIELREELREKGYSFASESDSEVILAAYQEWGKDCVGRFNGMWAFCIYDKKAECLFFSRDRFGVKPLYYFYDKKDLLFASEIKALFVHSDKIQPKPNDRAIFDYIYFTAVDYGPETFFKDIQRLEPGSNMIFDLKSRKLEFEQYYRFPREIAQSKASSEELGKLFMSSVQLRLRSDVPLGASLSGGIDSSSIVSVIQKKFRKDSTLQTFSIVFPGQKVDESKYIDEIIQDTHSEFNKVEPSFDEFMSDLDDFIYYQEEPVRTTSMYANYRIMRKVKEKGITVLLEGQGADELFGGYVPWMNYQVLVYLFCHWDWWCFLKEFFAMHRRYKISILKGLTGFLSFLVLDKSWIKKLYFYFNRGVLDSSFSRLVQKDSIIFKLKKQKTIKEALALRFHLGLAALLRYGDKNSMRFSVESRYPFLDVRLVDYVFANFDVLDYVKDARTKILFRSSMRDLVSGLILERDDKIGFETPQAEWFRREKFTTIFNTILQSSSFQKRKYWNHLKIEKQFEAHVSGKTDYSKTIWKVLNVELWFSKFMPNA